MGRFRRTTSESMTPQTSVAELYGGQLPARSGERGRHRAERGRRGGRFAVILGALAAIAAGNATTSAAQTTPGAMIDSYSYVQPDAPTITAGGAGQGTDMLSIYNGTTQERVRQPATVLNIGVNPTEMLGVGPWSGVGDHSLAQTEDITRDIMVDRAHQTGSNTLAGYSAGTGGTLEAGIQLTQEGHPAYVTVNDSEYAPGGGADQVNGNPIVKAAFGAVGVNFSEANNVNNLPAGMNVTYNNVNSVYSAGVASVKDGVLTIRNPIAVVQDTINHYDGSTDPGNFKPTKTESYDTPNGAHVTVNTMDSSANLPDIQIPLPPAPAPAPSPEQVITHTQNDFNAFVDQAEQAGLPPAVADQGRQAAADLAAQARQANDAINTQIQQANNFIAGLFPPAPAA